MTFQIQHHCSMHVYERNTPVYLDVLTFLGNEPFHTVKHGPKLAKLQSYKRQQSNGEVFHYYLQTCLFVRKKDNSTKRMEQNRREHIGLPPQKWAFPLRVY